MKYMQTGGFQKNPLMRLTIGLTLLFLAGLWLTNLLIFTSKMDLSVASIATYYRGSEADFIVARSYDSMLEVSHSHLPMMAIVILLLTHLLIFAPFSDATKTAFIVGSFATAFLNEASSWLIRFVSPGFAVVKLACFLGFQAVLLFLIVSLAWFLYTSARGERRAQRD